MRSHSIVLFLMSICVMVIAQIPGGCSPDEPYNSQANGKPISLTPRVASTFSSIICAQTLEIFYNFNLPSNADFSANLTFVDFGADIDIELLDDSAQVVGSSTGTTTNEQFSASINAGDYSFRVFVAGTNNDPSLMEPFELELVADFNVTSTPTSAPTPTMVTSPTPSAVPPTPSPAAPTPSSVAPTPTSTTVAPTPTSTTVAPTTKAPCTMLNNTAFNSTVELSTAEVVTSDGGGIYDTTYSMTIDVTGAFCGNTTAASAFFSFKGVTILDYDGTADDDDGSSRDATISLSLAEWQVGDADPAIGLRIYKQVNYCNQAREGDACIGTLDEEIWLNPAADDVELVYNVEDDEDYITLEIMRNHTDIDATFNLRIEWEDNAAVYMSPHVVFIACLLVLLLLGFSS